MLIVNVTKRVGMTSYVGGPGTVGPTGNNVYELREDMVRSLLA